MDQDAAVGSKQQQFATYESAVRSYCRRFPAIFERAENYRLVADDGTEYLDFLAGAGSLNYGHNNPEITAAVIQYLQRQGIVHSLDLHTGAKLNFINAFQQIILAPRQLQYKLQFPGPTGTNAVEAALKLARKLSGRSRVIAFTNAFHGMSLGAMAVSAKEKMIGTAVLMPAARMPYDGYMGVEFDTLKYLEKMIEGPGGVDWPAAIILETVQGEGGLNVASIEWLRGLAKLARRHQIVLIVDDIQAGCGRTGTFFSFERAGIQPDIVCLSKSIGGIGLPMSLVLLKPDLDVWEPGEHNGTFRGNNLAFVAGTQALQYWRTPAFAERIAGLALHMTRGLDALVSEYPQFNAHRKGIGLMQGVSWDDPAIARAVSMHAFRRGLIVETCGPYDEVVKLMPPLTIDDAGLDLGLEKLRQAVAGAFAETELQGLGRTASLVTDPTGCDQTP